MSTTLRTTLITLAEQLADRLEVSGAPATAAMHGAEGSDPEIARLLAALQAFAGGDVSQALAARVGNTGRALAEGIDRVRGLVLAARSSRRASGEGVDEARAACDRVAEALARQRLGLDRQLEQYRSIGARCDELVLTATDVADSADRAGLLSLNTGIEGLRVGGETARTLGALGDELGRIAQRCSTGAREMATVLRATAEAARANASALEEIRASTQRTGDEATRAAGLAAAVRRADTALEDAVAPFRAVDEETDATVARIDAAARALAREIAFGRGRSRGGVEAAARAAIEDAIGRALREAQDGHQEP